MPMTSETWVLPFPKSLLQSSGPRWNVSFGSPWPFMISLFPVYPLAVSIKQQTLKQQQASLICLVTPCPAQGLVLRTAYHIGYVSRCARGHISMPLMSCFPCLEFSFPSYLLVWLMGFFSTQIHNYFLFPLLCSCFSACLDHCTWWQCMAMVGF